MNCRPRLFWADKKLSPVAEKRPVFINFVPHSSPPYSQLPLAPARRGLRIATKAALISENKYVPSVTDCNEKFQI